MPISGLETAVPVTIRQATIADLADFARLLNQSDDTTVSPEQIAHRMEACANVVTIYLGLLDGHVAGFASLRLLPELRSSEPAAELTDLYVDPQFRHRGVGCALIARVNAAASAAGAREIRLITGFTNVIAQAAYEAAGYTRDALAMRKSFALQIPIGPRLPGA